MTSNRFRSRTVGVLAVSAIAALGATQAAQAATPAKTTDYSTATYLQNTLGFPASETAPALQPVTYDRFQWLLQQPGQLAILIGDPATDPQFAARARDAEAAADAAGAKTVYWFNPNLSGGAKIGATTEPNLDIRTGAEGSSLTAPSKAKYTIAWQSLVANYLGNGKKATVAGLNTGSSSVTIATDETVVNDPGGTEVGNPTGPALYDYRAGATPADLGDTVFLVYDKDRRSGPDTQKIAAWTDLGEHPTSQSARTAITSAIASVGGATIDAHSEYAWWKDATNAKHETALNGRADQGAGVPLIAGADDAANDWRVNQITYPELVDLLAGGANDENAVILFGGVWCPNTRAVLPELNRFAKENGVEIYNFDTVLDGGLVAGTTSTSNPSAFQIRNPHGGGAVPSFLYGDLVNTYLKNVKTQSGNVLTYYPGGNTGATAQTAERLQVPFLIGYENGSAGPGNGVTRQWIIGKQGGGFTEYMTNRWLSDPKPNQVALGTTLPAAAPAWGPLNQKIATATWDTPVASLVPNSADLSDSASYLVPADKATVVRSGSNVDVQSSATGDVNVGPSDLSTALAAVSLPANATLASAKAELVSALDAPTPDATRVANLRTVVGAWGVSTNRKTTITQRWGDATNPNSILGGLAAIHAGKVFFDGLPRVADPTPVTPDPVPVTPVTPDPGPAAPVAQPITQPTPIATPKPVAVLPTKKVSKVTGGVVKAPTSRRGGTYRVAIAVPKGARAVAGTVTVKLKKGAVTKTVTGTLKKGAVTVKVPKLAKGTWKVTITWPGDATFAKTSKAGKAIKVRR